MNKKIERSESLFKVIEENLYNDNFSKAWILIKIEEYFRLKELKK